jgi:CheY-like chemotaxis protein
MPETSHIPVIALTAAASERDRKRGEQAGFYRYLTKPVKVDELEAALEPLLSPAG